MFSSPKGVFPFSLHQESQPLGGSSSGCLQFSDSFESDKSDWLRILNECSTHAQKIRSGQRWQSLVSTKGSWHFDKALQKLVVDN